MKKRSRLGVCLVAGILILSVSAFAAFDSVSGYAQYKTAAKALLLQTDNVTVSGTATIRYDGKEIGSTLIEAQKDGKNNYSHTRETTGNDDPWESFEDTHNGVRSWYTVGMTNEKDQPFYYVDKTAEPYPENLLSMDMSDEMSTRLVAFAEIAVDTVVGDLKNNFVQVGAENGVNTYRVDIDENQVPALVSAGLSLLACAQTESVRDYSCVNYESDWNEMAVAYYEKTTGETLPDEFRTPYLTGNWGDAWYETYESLYNKVSDMSNEMDQEYWDMVSEKGGVVYVHEDWSYDYYADRAAYLAAHPEEAGMDDMMAGEMVLQHVTCEFSVDKAGHLLANNAEAVFAITDLSGDNHEFVVAFDLSCSNYGTTEAQHIDTAGMVMEDVNEATEEYTDDDGVEVVVDSAEG